MMRIKEFLLLAFFCGGFGLSNASIEEDLFSFSKCHNLNRRVLRSFYKDGTLFVWKSDTLFSLPQSRECSKIRIESVNQSHICQSPQGDMFCYVVALDDLSENNFLTLDFPAKNKKTFRLKNLDGNEKKLDGDILWGVRRMPAFMRGNVIVLLYKTENREYELITYKIKGSNVKEVYREKYPYSMQENSWGMPEDYIFPCDEKMCIYNDKTKKFYHYKNKYLAK